MRSNVTNLSKQRPDPILSFWRRYNPYWTAFMGLVTVAFVCGFTWHQYSTLNPRIETLEKDNSASIVDRAVIKQSLLDIAESVRRIDQKLDRK